MAAGEVFERLSSRLVEGMMVHSEMADCFCFLGLQGFKRVHECRFIDESIEMRTLRRYYIERFGEMVPVAKIEREHIIPSAWLNFRRTSMEPRAKRDAVKTLTEDWVEWERGTKELCEDSVRELESAGEVAAADYVRGVLEGVDLELKHAERLMLSLAAVDYDLAVVVPMQDGLHDRYKARAREIVERAA